MIKMTILLSIHLPVGARLAAYYGKGKEDGWGQTRYYYYTIFATTTIKILQLLLSSLVVVTAKGNSTLGFM